MKPPHHDWIELLGAGTLLLFLLSPTKTPAQCQARMNPAVRPLSDPECSSEADGRSNGSHFEPGIPSVTYVISHNGAFFLSFSLTNENTKAQSLLHLIRRGFQLLTDLLTWVEV